MALERAPIAETLMLGEELQPTGIMQFDQAGQEQLPEQLAEDADRQQERAPR